MGFQIVLVDKNNTRIGTADKADVHTADTPLHRGLSVFLFNSGGELLLQQRAAAKKTFPLVWSNSCCGHPLPDEPNIDAARRHLKHELGIEKAEIYNILPDFRYTATDANGIVENEFCPVFSAFSDEKPQPNPREVEDIKWINWDKFLYEITESSANYSKWSVEEATLLKNNNKFKKLYSQNTQF